jgi:talin
VKKGANSGVLSKKNMLTLRVRLPPRSTEGRTAGELTRTMRFSDEMTGAEALAVIVEKTGLEEPGRYHLFLATNTAADRAGLGRFLDRRRTLEFYDLQNNDLVELRERRVVLRVSLVDGARRNLLVDLTQPLSEVVTEICTKLGIGQPEEYRLRLEENDETEGDMRWLVDRLPLLEQVQTTDQVFALRRMFGTYDAPVESDPVQLHLVYVQIRDDITRGVHPLSREEAIRFAALQMQVQSGDCQRDSSKSEEEATVRDCLPPLFAAEPSELVFGEWEKFLGVTEVQAKLRYVVEARQLRTYGMTLFNVQEKVPGKKKPVDTVLGITRDSIFRMERDTGRVIREHPFRQLKRWAVGENALTLDFGDYEDEYVVFRTGEGDAIGQLITGYIDLLLARQRDAAEVVEEGNAREAAAASHRNRMLYESLA